MSIQSCVKILFLAADPSDAARLRLGQELRDIRERLQLSRERNHFLLESREAVRPKDITQAIFGSVLDLWMMLDGTTKFITVYE